ncbi:hypothetical protein RhiirA5_403980 [Rhizophagus irregularis]|uniref:Uncharacterized protein n=1 Tax=Rhizophagus irregularis TaxID=588596 RepID=A0A2N0NUQ5_9GLOM|nr:hypothetical protein RhiirA5_403980 [Rhizophagus irregularis]
MQELIMKQSKNLESKDKMHYFLAHQVRKVYLNSQFKAQLLELDEYGAILVCDYKMRILQKSARETKEEFFGKRGWTLHTILVFTKKDDTNLNVHAFDHWSTDTKQDAWFTAFSFNAVFETLDPKPQWVKILSDNGRHYHNSELMTLITNWHQWYNIEVRGWYFLEPGEAKTSVDSHHAQVDQIDIGEIMIFLIFLNEGKNIQTAIAGLGGTSVANLEPIAHVIKRYIRIRHCLDEGKNIQTAISGLGGISVVNLEPVRNNATVKTIAGITKLSYFEWPITGDYADIESFSLTNGWALRNNQKYGKKGSGKHITATVKLTLRDISCQKMQTKQIVCQQRICGHNTQETRGIRNKRLWCEEEKKVCNNIKCQKKITLASKTC